MLLIVWQCIGRNRNVYWEGLKDAAMYLQVLEIITSLHISSIPVVNCLRAAEGHFIKLDFDFCLLGGPTALPKGH